MKRKLRIGFAGAGACLDPVQSLVLERFPEIDPVFCRSESIQTEDAALRDMTGLKAKVDGLIFDSELRFHLLRKPVSPAVPCSWIERDGSSLSRTLLPLARQGIDIANLSIDAAAPAAVERILKDAGVTEDRSRFLSVLSADAGSDCLQNLLEEHRNLYRSGAVSGCLTSWPMLYSRLAEEGIPAACCLPSAEDIALAVAAMEETLGPVSEPPDEGMAVLSIFLRPRADAGEKMQTSASMRAMEEWKAASELYRFADRTGAAVVQNAERHFLILLTCRKLMEYTSSMKHMPFLSLIQENSLCEVCIGIGFGSSPKDAQDNADLALRSAIYEDGASVFTADGPESVTGPVVFERTPPEPRDQAWVDMQSLAEKTGVSFDKLYRLQQLMRSTGRNSFTAASLADMLHMSMRTANRLLAALAETGYAEIRGRTATGHSGRPSHIYYIRFRT